MRKNYPQMHELRNELSSLKKELEEHENTIDELQRNEIPPNGNCIRNSFFYSNNDFCYHIVFF